MIQNFWESMSAKSLWNEAPIAEACTVYTHVVTVRLYYVLPCFVRLDNSFMFSKTVVNDAKVSLHSIESKNTSEKYSIQHVASLNIRF